MYNDINNELKKLKQEIYRCQNIDTMLKNLREQLQEQEKKQISLEYKLEKENLDVEKFSKMSITNIFYAILGSREDQVEKERREVLAAQLKLDDVNKQIIETKEQISKFQLERSKVSDATSRYNELYENKYNSLKEMDLGHSEKILEIENEIASYKSNLKEIKEAIIAGKSVLISLDKVDKSLNSAESWGTWDLLGGGGLITNLAKHDHIDNAKDAVSEVQTRLNRFTTELTDVKVSSSITIDISGFIKFADFFFDGLISDWIVQSKIRDSQQSVKNVRSEVNKVLNNLLTMENRDKNSLSVLEHKLSQIILNA